MIHSMSTGSLSQGEEAVQCLSVLHYRSPNALLIDACFDRGLRRPLLQPIFRPMLICYLFSYFGR